MISAKIHHTNPGSSQEHNSEFKHSSVEHELADHFALASKYYAEARKCMARGDMEEANSHLAMAMDYATAVSDEIENQPE